MPSNIHSKKALSIISERRRNAQFAADEHWQEITVKFPAASDIKKEMDQTSIALSKIILEKPSETKELVLKLRDYNLSLQQKIRDILIRNKYPSDYISVNYTCAKCEDTGYYNGEKCTCFKKLVFELSINELNKNSPLELSDFSTFYISYYPDEAIDENGIIPRIQMKRIYEHCKMYAGNFSINSPSIFMVGATGLGKTHLSLAIAKKVISDGFTAVYGSVSDLVRDIASEQFGKSASKDTLRVLFQTDLLILDDLGAEFESNFNTSVIYNILNTRQNFRKPMIVNTNLEISELEDMYNPRIVSRLLSFDVLRFRGRDIRQMKR